MPLTTLDHNAINSDYCFLSDGPNVETLYQRYGVAFQTINVFRLILHTQSQYNANLQ